jgi:hypothetical protein
MIASRTADIVGFIGALTILGGFAYQTVRNAAPNLVSNALNFVGASLLALSLSVNYNLPALALELAWAGIALFGLARTLGTKR